MNTQEMMLNEIVELRKQVFGRDNGYSDELAEAMHIDEEDQRQGESDESYKARQLRVKERKERLNVSKETRGSEQKTNEVKK